MFVRHCCNEWLCFHARILYSHTFDSCDRPLHFTNHLEPVLGIECSLYSLYICFCRMTMLKTTKSLMTGQRLVDNAVSTTIQVEKGAWS